MSELTTVYAGVEIRYDEKSEGFLFELRGKERFATTLKLAKKAIDAPPPKEKDSFERIKAYAFSYSNEHILVDVTSKAADDYGSARYWTVDEGGARVKRMGWGLVPVNAQNDALIKEYDALIAQRKALSTLIDETRAKMTTLKREKED